MQVNADGSSPMNLTKTPDVNEMYPHVSPDGTKIAFLVNAGKGEATRRSAWYMNYDGTGRTKVADEHPRGLLERRRHGPGPAAGRVARQVRPRRLRDARGWSSTTWRPARSRAPEQGLHHLIGLCLVAGRQVVPGDRLRRDGLRAHQSGLRGEGTKVFDLHITGCRPDLTLDGKRLAWGSQVSEISIGDMDLRAEAGDRQPPRCSSRAGRGMKVYHVDWSPDGKYVAFSRGPESSDMGPAPEQLGVTGQGWNICVGNGPTANRWVTDHDRRQVEQGTRLGAAPNDLTISRPVCWRFFLCPPRRLMRQAGRRGRRRDPSRRSGRGMVLVPAGRFQHGLVRGRHGR